MVQATFHPSEVALESVSWRQNFRHPCKRFALNPLTSSPSSSSFSPESSSLSSSSSIMSIIWIIPQKLSAVQTTNTFFLYHRRKKWDWHVENISSHQVIIIQSCPSQGDASVFQESPPTLLEVARLTVARRNFRCPKGPAGAIPWASPKCRILTEGSLNPKFLGIQIPVWWQPEIRNSAKQLRLKGSWNPINKRGVFYYLFIWVGCLGFLNHTVSYQQ